MDQRMDRGIAHVAAVPIGLALDLDRREQERQAGGSQQGIDRDLVAREDLQLALLHIGRGDVETDILVLAQDVEIDDPEQRFPQGIVASGIELIGRHHPDQQVEPDIDRRHFQVGIAGQTIQPCRLEWAEACLTGHSHPEPVEQFPRFLTAADRHAIGQDGTVDGTGAGAADAFIAQPVVLQQAVEHAPGKGAMGACPLESQIDRLGLRRTGFGSRYGLFSYCAVHPPSMVRAAPVMLLAASELRNTASSPSCSGVTNLLEGCFSPSRSRAAASPLRPLRSASASICFWTRGVSTQPGQMQLEVIPVSAFSSAATLLRPMTPCLAATYADLFTLATRPWADAMLMRRPQPRCFIPGRA